MKVNEQPIGFFDSGVGGISVLKEAIKLMPNESFVYFGDSKNAPYGTKKVNEVRDLSIKAAEFLREKEVKALVVACNTATSAAIKELRKRYKDMPVIGIEPALKPAVEMKRQGTILIMATPMTLAEKKFNKLMTKYKNSANIEPLPCDGLVELIESGKIDSLEMDQYIYKKVKNHLDKEISAVVLGCTHYPFIANKIREYVGSDVPIIHGGPGTAKQIKRKLHEWNILSDNTEGSVQIYNSLNKELIDLSLKLLESNDK